MSQVMDQESQFYDQPFTIHLINSYANVRLSTLGDFFEVTTRQLSQLIRSEHEWLVDILSGLGVEYKSLRGALTPTRQRYEAAFIFESGRGGGFYGESISRLWLKALRDHGPTKTAISAGDILMIRHEEVLRQLDTYLQGFGATNRPIPSEYYAVHFSNLSAGQLKNMDESLRAAGDIYLGYVDCTTWNPIKYGMLLPQFGLRYEDQFILGADEEGYAYNGHYPLKSYGFSEAKVPGELFETYLTYRFDNGMPDWADADSSIGLSVLGGTAQPASSIKLELKERRFAYLMANHGDSVALLGAAGVDRATLARAIETKLSKGLIYNIRFQEGLREGKIKDPTLDALMFTVQVEFPKEKGGYLRFQAGMKYSPESHTGEIVTLF